MALAKSFSSLARRAAKPAGYANQAHTQRVPGGLPDYFLIFMSSRLTLQPACPMLQGYVKVRLELKFRLRAKVG